MSRAKEIRKDVDLPTELRALAKAKVDMILADLQAGGCEKERVDAAVRHLSEYGKACFAEGQRRA